MERNEVFLRSIRGGQWTKAKEAAALEEIRKKMEARHIQKEAENGEDGEAKENGNEKTGDAEVSKDDGNNNANAKKTEQPGKRSSTRPKLYLKEQVRGI